MELKKVFGEYSKLSQKYIEVEDELRGLESELQELMAEGLDAPAYLIEELNAYKASLFKLEQEGKERFNKTPKEMRKDGWEFWIVEDRILRQQRYGN